MYWHTTVISTLASFCRLCSLSNTSACLEELSCTHCIITVFHMTAKKILWTFWYLSFRVFNQCQCFLSPFVAKHVLCSSLCWKDRNLKPTNQSDFHMLGAGHVHNCFSGSRLEFSPLDKIQLVVCEVLPVCLELKIYKKYQFLKKAIAYFRLFESCIN